MHPKISHKQLIVLSLVHEKTIVKARDAYKKVLLDIEPNAPFRSNGETLL